MRTIGIVMAMSFAVGCGSGSKGDTGDNGPAGPTGPTGMSGTAGPSGPVGPTGITGPAGASGPTGAMGDPGAAGATGTQGPPGPVDPTAPSKPTLVHLTPRAGDGTLSTLHWSAPASSIAIDYYIVYSSTQSIAGNKAAASQEAVPAASHKDAVLLEANSGLQHFAVSAVSYTGVEGALSDELVVDTTSRLAVRSAVKTAGVEQLQVLSAGGSTVANPLATGPVLNCTSGSPGCTAGQFTSTQGVDAFFWSPLGTQIAYVGHLSTGHPELWMVAADGTQPVFNVSGPIVTGGSVKSTFTFSTVPPAFSPDGSAIAFLGDLTVHNVVELWVAPAASVPSPAPVRLNAPFGSDTTLAVTSFQWSPDGGSIAFLSDQQNNPGSELFIVPAGGGTNTKLSGTMADTSRNVSFFAWSPDGTRLAFVADRDTAGVPELYVVGAGGGAITKVSGTLVGGSTGVNNVINGLARPFEWSPAGDRLAFLATKDESSTTELYVVAATGGPVTKLSGQIPVSDAVSEFAWSPDGAQVAFMVNDLPNTGLNLDTFVASAGGGPVVASGSGQDVATLSYSLNGELAFRVDRAASFTYDLEIASGTNMSNVFDVINPLTPFTNANYNVNVSRTPPAWSPDGSRIAFLADADGASIFSLFVAVTRGMIVRLSDTPATRTVDNFAWSPLGFAR